jgi:prophage regulatory protein
MTKPEVTGKKVQRIFRLPMVLDATGWSRSTLYAKINEGKFPAGIKLDPDGGRAVGWTEDDVLTHQHAMLATRATEAA